MTTTINVLLTDKNDFYSNFSNKLISEELKNYICDECNGENWKNHIIININTNEYLTDEEKNNMMDAIRRTFGLIVQDELLFAGQFKKKNIILLLLGLALILFDCLITASVLYEIILILGWLAIWESVYNLVFDVPLSYNKILRLKELAKARVYFKEIS